MLPPPQELATNLKNIEILIDNPVKTTNLFINEIRDYINKASGVGLYGNNRFDFPTYVLREKITDTKVTFPEFATPAKFIEAMVESFEKGILQNVRGDSIGVPSAWFNTFDIVSYNTMQVNVSATRVFLNQLYALKPTDNPDAVLLEFAKIINRAVQGTVVSISGLSKPSPGETSHRVPLHYTGNLY